jgi:hypothetical protein
MVFSWLRSLKKMRAQTAHKKGQPGKKRAARQLSLEFLEDRFVPSASIDQGGIITLPISGIVQEGTRVAAGTTLLELTDHGGANVSASDFTAKITWGDGSSDTVDSSGNGPAQIVFVGSGNDGSPFSTFDVIATANSHVYDEVAAGTKFTVKATDLGSGNSTGSISTRFTANTYVTDAPLTAGPLSVPSGLIEGDSITNQVVFQFTDANPNATASDYVASVTLGDGNTVTLTSAPSSNGQIVADGAGFDVQLTHTYLEEMSSQPFSVRVTDDGGAAASASGTITVADASLTAGALTPAVATEGAAFGPVTVFHFSDANPSATATDYVATVNTGDATLDSTNNPSNVTIVANSNGGFDVQLAYTYAEELTGQTFSVSVQDNGGAASISASTTVGAFSVADADLKGALALNVGAETATAFANVPVATFQDPGGAESIDNYAATINWGDGGTSSGTITYDSTSNTFTVLGSYTYQTTGTYPISVQVTHDSADPLSISGGTATVTTSVWVNDNWVDAAHPGNPQLGDTVTAPSGETAPNATTLIYGVNAFSTIQAGVNADVAGGTVYVLPGTYAENVVIDKSISLLGPNQGIAGTGTRGAEAVVEPGLTSSYSSSSVFEVDASNVTIDGFTIQGSIASQLSGQSTGFTLSSNTTVYAAAGISNFSNVNGTASANVSGLTIQNDVIQDFTQVGVYGDTTDGTVSTGNTIANNLIQDVPNNGQGGYVGEGVIIYDNFYADVTGNTISNVRTGIQTGNNYLSAGSFAPSISDNVVSASVKGIYYNLQYESASPFTISDNTITQYDGSVSPAYNVGLLIQSIQGSVQSDITGNNVSGFLYGVELAGNNTTNTVTVQGGTLSNNTYGVWDTNNDYFYPASYNTAAALNGVTITGSTNAGIWVDSTSANSQGQSNTTNTASLAIGGGTTVTGGAVGLKVSGAQAAITGNTLNDTSFSGQSGNYVTLANGAAAGLTLDATGASFGGVTGGTATLAQNFAIEDMITDYLDDPTLGYVTLNAGNVYLAASSEAANAGSIQRGINAASSGDTVNVQAGTYVANTGYVVSGSAVGGAGQEIAGLNIDKPITLLGPNASYDPNSSLTPANDQAIIVPGASDPNPYDPNGVIVMLISSSNVTVQGITVDGSNPNLTHYYDNGALSGYTGYVTAYGSTTPIDAAEDIASYANVSNVTVQNNVVRNAGYVAVDFNNGTDYSGTATTGNVISKNLIQNASDAYHYGDGINLYNNFYADVTGNVIQDVRTGVQLGNYSQANPNADPAQFANVANNTISADRIGLWYNLFYAGSSAFTFANNTISALPLAGNSKWDGVLISSIQGTSSGTFQGNSIDGSQADPSKPSDGYDVWNTPTTGQLLISGGTVQGVDYGVWVNTYEGYSSPAAATQVTVSGTTISASQLGVYVEDSAANTGHPSATAIIEGNTSITTTGPGTGILVSGAKAGATITDSSVTGNATGIDVEGGSLTATNNFITGNTGPAIFVGSTGTPSVTVRDNDLSNNGSTAVQNNNSITVDAAENYWGSAYLRPAAVAGLVSGPVNFEPMLTSGDADISTAGFQPDTTKLAVDISAGTTSTTEGATYVLNLAPSNPTANNATITGWVIQWGDGTPDTILSSPGIPASITHTYAEEGSYTITAVATDELGYTATTSVAPFSVADAALAANLFTPPVATEGAAFNGTVLNFSDADPNATASDYTAVVTLGDGNQLTLTSTASANGQIVAHGDGTFDVNLSYTYAEPLSGQTFSVVVTDSNSQASGSTSNFSVADAALTAGSLTPPAATEGAAFSGVVLFHFTDANPAATAANFTATVNWGDGTSNTSADNSGSVSVVANPGGGFDVLGSYTYAEELNGQTFSVSVQDSGSGTPISASTTHYTVADAALTAGALTAPTPTEGAALTDVQIFHFTDADPNAQVGDYVATITWGDGTTSTVTSNPTADGQIVANPNGGFDVLGSHTYLEEGTGLPFSVSVTDHSGYNNGFETAASTNDWTEYASGTDGAGITRETSGSGQLPSAPASGNYFAVVTNTGDGYATGYGGGGYTYFGGDQQTYTGPFQQSVSIYVNTAWAAPANPSVPAFWLDMTPDHQDPNNFGAEHSFRFYVDGSGSIRVTADSGDPSNPLATITTSGWYTFQMVYYKAANPSDPALTDLNVYDTTNTLVGSQTGLQATSPGGPFLSSDLTGHGYAWLTVWQNGFANDQLAIDNLSTSVLPISASGSVNVADAALTGCSAASASNGVEGVTAATLGNATFSDANTGAPSSDFTVTAVNWGDGSTDASGLTVTGSGGNYVVNGSHLYGEEGGYNFSITVTDKGGNTATITGTASVADANLTGSSAATAGGVEGVTAATLGNATFSDANTSAPASDFTVTAVTWGDGSTDTTGLTVTGSGGSYVVNGSHLYGEDGSYNFSVTVTDAGGNTATITGTASVADANLTGKSAATASGVEGVTAATLGNAIFSDANTSAPASDFTVTAVNWGDGSTDTSGLTVTGSGGSYVVSGSHLYGEDGSYSFSVTVTDKSGNTATITGTATVADAALAGDSGSPDGTGGGYVMTGTEGSDSGLQTVATFTDPGGAEDIGDYSASINWGDGHTSAGTITYDSTTGLFTVQGSNTYAEESSYTVTTTIQHDSATPNLVVTSTALVDDAALQSAGVAPLVAREGTSTTLVVATFTDANPGDHTGDFTATIDWGVQDSTGAEATSPGVVSYDVSTGIYTVTGTHIYLTPTKGGMDTITVDVSDTGGAGTEVQSYVTVTNVSPTPSISGPASGVPGQTLHFVGSFTDPGQGGDETYTFAWTAKLNGTGQVVASATTQNFDFTLPTGNGPAPSYTISFKVTDSSGGSGTVTKTVKDPASSLTADEQFVQALYLNELGRSGSISELDVWAAVLPSLGRSGVVARIMDSPEAHEHLVQGWYVTYLGRQANGVEELGWVNLLQTQTEEQVLSQILGSQEFYDRAQTVVSSGTPNERYVQALYQSLLGRSASTAEVAGSVGALSLEDRSSVALGFLQSQELRTELIQGYYTTLLNRPADTTGLVAWVSSGLDLLSVRAGFEASDEFFANG